MPVIKILPNEALCPEGAEVEVETGKFVAQALNAAGIKLPHACEYNCACATCHIIIREGFDTLEEADDDELDQIDLAFGSCATSRLGCRTKMGESNITIEIPKNNRNLVNED